MALIVVVFWVAAGLIAYSLVGYPLLTLLLAAVIRKNPNKGPITPKVSYIIAAYNEEKAIEEKLRKTLELDYPKELLEIIVASDGSTDRTDEIVRSFAEQGVKLHRSSGRMGKTATVNGAVLEATGDVVVFSDATGIYNKESLRELVANFNDPTVGCVAGRVAYRYTTDATSKGFKAYQRLVVGMRRAESLYGSQTSVSGSIHAIRRELYRPADPAFTTDLSDAVNTVAQGYRVIYEDRAASVEESRARGLDEFHARVRISIRAMTMLPYIVGQLVRNRRFGYLFQMFSHKFLRWWLWLLLIIVFVTNALLIRHSPMYVIPAIAQGLLYVSAAVGFLADRWGLRIPFVGQPYFFVLGNAAMCIGALKCLAGKRVPTWQPVR